ncbi:MAG: hypothetical protein KY475_00615 [Planctomycetes bacterium]|nr:hypothetical protein [Planctomycetota bacterium]
MSRSAAVWLILYIAWMSLLVGGLIAGRQAVLQAYSGAEAKAEWDEFRRDMAKLSEEGPVKRRAPKSPEPPALRLMRDYFGVCLTATIVFGSLLFAMLAGAGRGAFSQDVPPRDEAVT